MTRIIETFYYDEEILRNMGFKTDRQIQSIIALSDVMTQIKDMPEDFCFMTFLIKEADMLGHRPIEIMSNLTREGQRIHFENYILKRLKKREKDKA